MDSQLGCMCRPDCYQLKCCPDYAAACEGNQVSCGLELCYIPNGEKCCSHFTGTFWSQGCATAADGPCSGSFPITCNGPEDCYGGDVCCGTLNAGLTQFTKIQCEAPSSCVYGLGKRVMCFLNPAACPSGYVCKPSPAPPGTSYCGVP